MDQLRTIELVLEQSFVILEHRFYNGSRAPVVTVFDDFNVLDEYRDDNSLAHGKMPDEQGRTPRGGAY